MDNYASVVHQMEAFGVEFTSKDLPLQIPTPKRKTCGKKGKWWYWLQEFRPHTGGTYVVGKFGTYKHGGSEAKVEVDWKPLSDADRARFRAEHEAAERRAKEAKEQAALRAAVTATELWPRASRDGHSPYLERKGVQGESCRYLAETLWLQRHEAGKRAIELPPGTLVVPLIRYDKAKTDALRGLQLVKPDGFKIYTEGVSKNGCAVRLGEVDASTRVAMICEGYATGLSIRMATGRRWPVFVALDAYNLVFVVEILREVLPDVHLLICADDDWKTADHEGKNPGRTKAKMAAKTTPQCDIVWPVFDGDLRQEKDTDFNDLHLREGVEAVERQLVGVLSMIENGVRLGR
jgi:putative DNA primase/helicase